jgi:phage terminase large subunit-like protein
MARTTKTKTTSSSDDRTRAYAEDVVSGRVVAGPHVRNACRRHLLDMERGAERGLSFDHGSADRAFRFFEEKLRLSEGQFDGAPFNLHPSQAFIVGSLFGWKRADGTRRFRRCYIEQGKGNGKSPLAGGIGLYGLVADEEAGAQVYAAAAKREQAGILFADAVKMVKQSPALKKRLEFSGGEGREFNIAYHRTGSFFRPVSRDTGKTGSGPRPYFVLADEVHELPDRKILEMLERGFKFRRQPLLFMITNSGTDRNSVAWEEHEHAVKVAAGHTEAVNDPTFIGDPIDDTTFSFVCSLDEGDDPLNDPSCWVKANPLLGVTITEQYLADTVAQAKAIPGQLNGILRLHFCVWTDAETAWMTREVLDPCLADFDTKPHEGKKIWLGLDLSQTRDITAMGAVVQTGEVEVEVKVNGDGKRVSKPTYDAWIEAWTPRDTIDARELRDKIPYRVWRDQGHIHAPQGQSVSFRHVAQTLAEYASSYYVQMVAYDRYAFKRFEEDVDALGIRVEFVEHPQGGLKKGKPSEAMKKAAEAEGREPEGLWMPGSVKLLEEAMLEGRIRLKRNPVLVSAMLSAVAEEDKWGNHWLAKTRSVNKIDAAIALAMALGAASSVEVKKRPLLMFTVG